MTTKNQLRRLAGIDTRSKEQIEEDETKKYFEDLKAKIKQMAYNKYLCYTFDCRNPKLIDMVKTEYSDCKVTEANGKVTINWAEPDDIVKIKNRISQLEKELLVQTERRDAIQQMMIGRPVYLGPNEELDMRGRQIDTINSKIKFLKASFIE